MLAVEHLHLFYGDAQALDDVSLSIAAGELVAIVGANGAGKSSLIRTIAGIEKPRSGSIRFRDAEITGLPSHRICELGIGQVAEGRQIFASLTVEENLEIGAMLRRARDRLQAKPRADVCDVPAACRTAQPIGGHDVRRRAADAGDRALPDGAAGTDHLRRAVARPGADHRAGSVPHHPRPQ